MYVCMYNEMTLFSWSLNEKRKNLLELLSEHKDFREFNKSDLLEAGLSCLLHQSQEEKPSKEVSIYPRLDEYNKMEEFYDLAMKKEDFKKLDTFVNRLNVLHNRKWSKDEWL